jgi:hypothetical protein
LIDDALAVRQASEQRTCRHDNEQRAQPTPAIWQPIAHDLQTTRHGQSFKLAKLQQKGQPARIAPSKPQLKLISVLSRFAFHK